MPRAVRQSLEQQAWSVLRAVERLSRGGSGHVDIRTLSTECPVCTGVELALLSRRGLIGGWPSDRVWLTDEGRTVASLPEAEALERIWPPW